MNDGYPTLQPASNLALTNTANTFTAAQTIDLGSGTLPAALAGTVLRLSNVNGTNPRLESVGLGVVGLVLSGRTSGGTRTSPTATPDGQAISQMVSFCHDGTANWSGTGWATTRSGGYFQYQDGLASATNRGLFHSWFGVPNGSVTEYEWMRLRSGASEPTGLAALGIGVAPTTGNGLLQLASGTTKAYGIAFGTDTFVYSQSAGLLTLAGPAATDVSFVAARSTGESAVLYAGNGAGLAGTTSNHPFYLRTNSVTALTIDTSQNATFAGTISSSVSNSGTFRPLQFRNTSSAAGAYNILDLGNDTSATALELFCQSSANAGVAAAGGSGLWTSTATELVFGTSSAVRVRIGASGGFTFADANDFVFGTTTGSKIATASTQKLGFWGATPIAQKTGYGTPTGNVQTASFPGATATLLQTAQELAQLLLDLKAAGIIGA